MEPNNTNTAWRRLEDLLGGEETGRALARTFPLESTQQASTSSATISDNASGNSVSQRDASRLSLLAALQSADVSVSDEQHQRGVALGQTIEALFNQLSVFERLHRCPIVAITGMLNAGKSSLLATYLSPSGRQRVLRGVDNHAGTHRFVLWLPDRWRREPQLLGTLLNYLTDLFGHPPEHLSDLPREAAEQYNGRVIHEQLAVPPVQDPSDAPESRTAADRVGVGVRDDQVSAINIPLLAYDIGLDDLQIGLVDCPDIQTGFLIDGTVAVESSAAAIGADRSTTGAHGAGALVRQRQQQLSRLGRLCSAFVVVSKLGNLHDTDLQLVLTTLRDAMPGVPRLLAVNKIKTRYGPEVVAEQSKGLCERFGIESVYGAYDFRSSRAETRIPARPEELQVSDDEGDVPIFFEVSTGARPASVKSSVAPDAEGAPASGVNYLLHLSRRLDPGTLSRESTRSMLMQLRAETNAALAWLTRNLDQQSTQAADAWTAVAGACYEFMAERDESGRPSGLRLQASPTIVAQMADSLTRTAPLWMQASLSVDRTVRQMHQAVANSAARIKILQSASQSVTQFAKRFKRGEGAQVVTPERLADAIRGHDVYDAFFRVPAERMVVECKTAIKRFAAEDQTQLNEEELDEWSRQVWKTMPLKSKLWKGTQPLALLTAPLLAAVLVPFDGGGTAVLVFASTKELLAAAGVAAVLGSTVGGNEALSLVHQETPWRQLSDLFAIVCDSVGIPRPLPKQLPNAGTGQEKRRLVESTLQTKPTYQIAAVQCWQLPPELVQDVRSTLIQLG